MKCFIHQESDAIALCKHCAKGACRVCAVDTGNGVACSDGCAMHVAQLAVLMKSTTAAASINRGGIAFIWPAFLAVLGVAFILEAVLSGRPRSASNFGVIMGSLFVIFGVWLGGVQYVWRRRSAAQERT
jgi:hypothetical protein